VLKDVLPARTRQSMNIENTPERVVSVQTTDCSARYEASQPVSSEVTLWARRSVRQTGVAPFFLWTQLLRYLCSLSAFILMQEYFCDSNY